MGDILTVSVTMTARSVFSGEQFFLPWTLRPTSRPANHFPQVRACHDDAPKAPMAIALGPAMAFKLSVRLDPSCQLGDRLGLCQSTRQIVGRRALDQHDHL